MRAGTITSWSSSTEIGDLIEDLEPVLVQLERWAVRSPLKPDISLSLTSLILSFRTIFSP